MLVNGKSWNLEYLAYHEKFLPVDMRKQHSLTCLSLRYATAEAERVLCASLVLKIVRTKVESEQHPCGIVQLDNTIRCCNLVIQQIYLAIGGADKRG